MRAVQATTQAHNSQFDGWAAPGTAVECEVQAAVKAEMRVEYKSGVLTPKLRLRQRQRGVVCERAQVADGMSNGNTAS